MKRKPFSIKEAYKPTKDSLAEQNRRHKLYNYYGIPIGRFTDKNTDYTKEELKAIEIIIKNEKMPPDLGEFLLKTKGDRHKNTNSKSVNFTVTKEYEEYILNINKKLRRTPINFRKIYEPTITLAIIASQLMGCAAVSQSELKRGII